MLYKVRLPSSAGNSVSKQKREKSQQTTLATGIKNSIYKECFPCLNIKTLVLFSSSVVLYKCYKK